MPSTKHRGTDSSKKSGGHDGYNQPEGLGITPDCADDWPSVEYIDLASNAKPSPTRRPPDKHNPYDDGEEGRGRV